MGIYFTHRYKKRTALNESSLLCLAFIDNALQELTAITPRFMMEQLEEI